MSQKAPTGQEQPLLHGTPPPYGTSNYNHHYQSQEHPQGVTYVAQHPVVIQHLPGNIIVIKERARFRFCRALFWGIAVWLLLGAFVKSVLMWNYGFPFGTPRWTLGPGRESPDYPIPHGIELTSCEEPLIYGRSNQTSLQIPSSSNAALLLVDGRLLHGTVRITSTSARKDSVGFSVSLLPRHNRPANTIVCAVKRNDGEVGLGVFNPRQGWRRWENTVRYDIVVEFPENHPIVKRFESSVVNSLYEIDDLEGKILFETLSLRGSNGGIHSKSFFAQWASLFTSNGRIEGHFNASDFLQLHTSNGKIDADIDFNQDVSKKASLSLITTNAALDARISLHNFTSLESGDNTPSNFDVTSRTTNGKLNVAFLDAPVDSTLAYRGSTSNAATEISLHPTFEGHFSLQSSLFTPQVHEHRVEDPSGRGRERVVRFRNTRGSVSGEVVWGRGSEGGNGVVDVQTSNAKAILNL